MSFLALILAVALAGCSSGEAVSIEVLFGAQTDFGAQPPSPVLFRASGTAVSEGAVCESGTWRKLDTESPEGTTITSEEGRVLYEAARADEGTMEVYGVEEFVCDDGSGTFTMKVHSHVDFAKAENDQDTPTWEIESATGDYAGLSGSGEVLVELGASLEDTVHAYSGDVQAG